MYNIFVFFTNTTEGISSVRAERAHSIYISISLYRSIARSIALSIHVPIIYTQISTAKYDQPLHSYRVNIFLLSMDKD